MNCNHWRDQASDYIEGNLSAGAMAAVRAHLASCDACRSEEATLRTLWRELNVLPEPEPPMFFRDNVLAAVERQGTRKGWYSYEPRETSWFNRLFPSGSRVFGATLAGVGIAAAAALVIFLPTINGGNTGGQTEANIGGGAGVILPYAGETADTNAEEAQARLIISSAQTLLPDASTACDFTFWLENAEKGTATFTLVGDKAQTPYRFMDLKEAKRNILRVPFDIDKGVPTVGVAVRWTGNGQRHNKYLLVPTATDSVTPREEVQAFGLPEQPLVDAMREVSARYGVPITLEDVPADTRIAIYARGEKVSQTLRRQLEPLGLRVVRSTSGILIAPAAK